jgi:hypothetical protein
MEDLRERRQAELDFVAAAYSGEEAWCCEESSLRPKSAAYSSGEQARCEESGLLPTVYRRLEHEASADAASSNRVSFLLDLEMPESYPVAAALKVSGTVEEDRTCSRLVKSAFNALPALLLSCRETAESQIGEEAVFAVLSQADEWIQNEWSVYAASSGTNASHRNESTKGQDSSSLSSSSNTKACSILLGRRLIYSHHIIAKQKRADMRYLASHYKLTGYVKIGWPGIIILEGRDDDCNSFYDDMRRWNWKYLVLRGEMQEKVKDIESKRLFPTFLEVDDMSVVANHCREVGLESLFRTSMKSYNDASSNGNDDEQDCDTQVYGSLVHVDHMNDAKSYRKWLRKTCQEADVSLLIKQCYPNLDFTKRPKICVGLLGDRESVSNVLKRWRTSRVDVDSRGKPCLERMMKVIVEGNLDNSPSEGIDWDATNADERVTAGSTEVDGGLSGSTEVDGGLFLLAGRHGSPHTSSFDRTVSLGSEKSRPGYYETII